jgi:hypothetical protein
MCVCASARCEIVRDSFCILISPRPPQLREQWTARATNKENSVVGVNDKRLHLLHDRRIHLALIIGGRKRNAKK